MEKMIKGIKVAIVIAAAILYGVWPADIIPDLVPIFGLLDDLAAVIAGVVMAVSVVHDKRAIARV